MYVFMFLVSLHVPGVRFNVLGACLHVPGVFMFRVCVFTFWHLSSCSGNVLRVCLHVAGVCLHVPGVCLHVPGVCLHVPGVRFNVLGVGVQSDMCSCSGSGLVNICSCWEAVQPEHLFMFGEWCSDAAL